jgi:hypothetical protein
MPYSLSQTLHILFCAFRKRIGEIEPFENTNKTLIFTKEGLLNLSPFLLLLVCDSPEVLLCHGGHTNRWGSDANLKFIEIIFFSFLTFSLVHFSTGVSSEIYKLHYLLFSTKWKNF